MDRRSFLISTAALATLTGWTRTAVSVGHLYVTHNGRPLNLRLLLPARDTGTALPVILFSHGANSAAHLYDELLRPLAEWGALLIAVDHLDAGGTPPPERLPAEGLFQSRIDDLKLPLEKRALIDAYCAARGHYVDWARVCAMGHSFGGAVAQGLAGATMIYGPNQAAKARRVAAVSALITLSPPGPRAGLVPEDAWKTVDVPSVAVTGTRDILPGFIDDWRTHVAGMGHGAENNRWRVVGEGVDHYFGGLICRLKSGQEAAQQRPAMMQTVDLLKQFLEAWVGGQELPTPPQFSLLDIQRY